MRIRLPLALLAMTLLAAPLLGRDPGEGPVLGPDRITQEEIASGELGLDEIRRAGLEMFTAMFNRWDGLGDGPIDPADTLSPGGRPTLQGNGMHLRVNGLDAQGCFECHAVVRASSIPPLFGLGGAGTSNNNAIIKPRTIDVEDLDRDGIAAFDGRFANPPFVFGAGAVELLAAEMTEDLQKLKRRSLANPGLSLPLKSKGVSFGSIVSDGTTVDTSRVEGVEEDLVVRPFGRKGEFATIREFDVGAFEFHFGMQPVEVVGRGNDADQDGIADEVLIGELSALSAFIATIEPPFMAKRSDEAAAGFDLFRSLGCASCHVPTLETRSTVLGLRYPEVAEDPRANVFLRIDLAGMPGLPDAAGDGLAVPLFADLKRHDLGEELAEDFAFADEKTNREFTTARLWGVADTAPYLHDGRATTLTEAILAHGGEAEESRDAFAVLDDPRRRNVLAFLRSLRTPEFPAGDLIGDGAGDDDDEDEDETPDGPLRSRRNASDLPHRSTGVHGGRPR